jgi:release factor glutamine methyltransferase
MNTYRELLQTAREVLKQQGIADADVDAWYLLAHVFEINRADFLLHGDKAAPEEKQKLFFELLEQRAAHIPLQHLIGTQEFMGLEFTVSENVLIPRQDTETLVEEILKVCEGKKILDLCTGSGCIIISLAKLGKVRKAVGTDLSEKALQIATINVNKHMVEVELLHSDLLQRVEGEFDIIVSNPPYIPTKDIESLMPEVRDHEPRMALDGSADGLLFYRKIAAGAKEHLTANGLIFFEIGYNQGEEVKQILEKEGFADVKVKKDLSGQDRIVTGRYCL